MTPDDGLSSLANVECSNETTGSYWQRAASDDYRELIRAIDRVVFIVSIVIFLHSAYSYWPYLEDDVFIFFRYAMQFHAGHGWVMNPGERVNGCTSWLELWIVTFLTKSLTLDQTVAALKYLGVLCGIGTLFCARRIVDYCIPTVAGIGSVTCLLMVNMHCFSLSMVNALETPMACLFLTAGSYYAVVDNTCARKKHSYIAAIFFLLAALARPEMAILFPVLFVVQSVRNRKLNVGPLLVYVLPLCAVAALSAFWYGSALPNTYYAKYATIQQGVIDGGSYLLLCLLDNSWLLGILTVAAAGWFVYSKENRGRVVVVTVGAVYIAAILRSHGDWMQDERFAMPMLPFVGAFWVYVLALVLRLILRTKEFNMLLSGAVGLLFLYATVFYVGPAVEPVAHACDAFIRSNVTSPVVLWPSSTLRPLSMWMCGSEDGRGMLANWIKVYANPGDTVATTEMGLVTCLNPDIRFIDMLGLTDKTISHLPDYRRSCVGINSGEDWTDPDTPFGEYIEQRKPRYVIFPWSGQPPVAHHYGLISSLSILINNSGRRQFLVYTRR